MGSQPSRIGGPVRFDVSDEARTETKVRLPQFPARFDATSPPESCSPPRMPSFRYKNVSDEVSLNEEGSRDDRDMMGCPARFVPTYKESPRLVSTAVDIYPPESSSQPRMPSFSYKNVSDEESLNEEGSLMDDRDILGCPARFVPTDKESPRLVSTAVDVYPPESSSPPRMPSFSYKNVYDEVSLYKELGSRDDRDMMMSCPARFVPTDKESLRLVSTAVHIYPPESSSQPRMPSFSYKNLSNEVSLNEEGSMDDRDMKVGCPARFDGDETSPTDDYELRSVSTAPNTLPTTCDYREVVLHRVPPQVREKKKHIYEPSVVSLGPYHHLLDQYKDFKKKVLPVIQPDEIWTLVRENLAEIRRFYGEEDREFWDEALLEMMVADACLVVYNMEAIAQNRGIIDHATRTIGALGVTLMANDFSKLENQIPWWIIKALITSKYSDHAKGEELICKYLSYANFWEYDKLQQLPAAWKSKSPPHLLEARRRVFLKEEENNEKKKTQWWCRCWKSSATELTQLLSSPFRSASELRAKGIHFKKSSDFLNDITFVSHSLHGVLRLPVLRVDSETTTFFSNVIVLELSPGNTMSADYPVTSYINFMKSLIERVEDVKLLQEKGIIISYLMDSEQLVKIFNEIDTHDVNNFGIFKDVKIDINSHCNNRGKTWMAELLDTYCRSPWTAIALFAATFLLCLTFLQTYYTLNPVN